MKCLLRKYYICKTDYQLNIRRSLFFNKHIATIDLAEENVRNDYSKRSHHNTFIYINTFISLTF